MSIRQFETGANRNADNGKIDYEGFNHPLVEHEWGKYMHHHRHLEDGTLRDSDNWQKGIPKNVTVKSLYRHFEDLHALHRGLFVYKWKDEGGAEHTEYSMTQVNQKDWHEVTVEEACMAIRFNANDYCYEFLMGR